MYRQKKIFDFLKQQKIPLARMRRVVDSKGNTLLHHVAEKGQNSGVTKPGPALQLQEELQWFESNHQSCSPTCWGCEDIHLGFYRLYMHGSAHRRVHVHE
ncbi:hypothetical protein D5086_021171 [Populus alba]|uniref:Uncharacterized protein n=1 Tax=Populus alba TaxID=43335 RepID=A0ACC4BBD5_POPAL